SSDVCSSDLGQLLKVFPEIPQVTVKILPLATAQQNEFESVFFERPEHGFPFLRVGGQPGFHAVIPGGLGPEAKAVPRLLHSPVGAEEFNIQIYRIARRMAGQGLGRESSRGGDGSKCKHTK